IAERKTEPSESAAKTVKSDGSDERVMESVENGGDKALAVVTAEYESPRCLSVTRSAYLSSHKLKTSSLKAVMK
ncbi:hypothetical protein A2U01_0004594, partial [Trifolium medium]|nr:hypothetical protein [Trifolium medium]